MKEPHEVFADIYLERLRVETHDLAVVKAFAAVLFDLQSRGLHRYQDAGARLKLAADEWHSKGGSDVAELRERLRHEWTDWGLAQRTR
jgi:hypothetical protein